MKSRDVIIVARGVGNADGFAFEALCDGRWCGEISAYRLLKRVRGRVVYTVGSIEVATSARRRGIATKLYEAAANEACRQRRRLASTNRSAGAYSNDFWQKQVAKGRARAVRRRYGMPPAYVLIDCPVTTLARARRRR